EMKNDWAIKIPWVMGLLATRSIHEEIPGIKEIVAENAGRITSGKQAVIALERLRQDRDDAAARALFEEHQEDLGFGLLLKKHTENVADADEETILAAARDTVPKVAPMFWAFRIMVAAGFTMLLVFSLAMYASVKGNFSEKRWLLRLALWSLPLPWIACELGWFVAEYGRQPWTIFGVLPTHLSVSTLSIGDLYGSLAGFVGFYTLLLVVEMYLMIRFSRQGPGSLGTGRYANEPRH
ncbi:MAG: cytochrome ubiquinol oxidase subunit I, partial [Eubacteriales bacterium]|nr:cytochrome ubiquinol oxidase subunit I [Eubacteriales bacterium]